MMVLWCRPFSGLKMVGLQPPIPGKGAFQQDTELASYTLLRRSKLDWLTTFYRSLEQVILCLTNVGRGVDL